MAATNPNIHSQEFSNTSQDRERNKIDSWRKRTEASPRSFLRAEESGDAQLRQDMPPDTRLDTGTFSVPTRNHLSVTP